MKKQVCTLHYLVLSIHAYDAKKRPINRICLMIVKYWLRDKTCRVGQKQTMDNHPKK